jgi:hypothetical protein
VVVLVLAKVVGRKAREGRAKEERDARKMIATEARKLIIVVAVILVCSDKRNDQLFIENEKRRGRI